MMFQFWYLLCNGIVSASAISWPGRSRSQGVSSVVPQSVNDPGTHIQDLMCFMDIVHVDHISNPALVDLAEDEIGISARGISLRVEISDARAGKSDCFRRATGLIRASCSQLDMLEDERVKDIQSALSRSAQSWSSYSGYLRDVRAYYPRGPYHRRLHLTLSLAQLCSTFSKWNDIGVSSPSQEGRLADCGFPWVDLAREIYRNATLLKIKLIRSLNTREEKLHSYMRVWDENLEVIVAELITRVSVYNLLHTTGNA
ncbi:hypothetical protein IMY05_C4485000100 [Salix suchowensis]|nr:hypothetical protein IMY05_C4485000100 [Salix suchowensis]